MPRIRWVPGPFGAPRSPLTLGVAERFGIPDGRSGVWIERRQPYAFEEKVYPIPQSDPKPAGAGLHAGEAIHHAGCPSLLEDHRRAASVMLLAAAMCPSKPHSSARAR